MNKKIIYFVTVDWFFCSHFLARAVAAKAQGYEVYVLTNIDKHKDKILAAGLNIIDIKTDRKTLNPFSWLQTLLKVYQVYRTVKPDIVHHIALKPILLGSLAARMSSTRNVINAIVGGGYAFISNDISMRMLRPIIRFTLGKLLNPAGSKVVFENTDDLDTFTKSGQVRRDCAVLIRGAGVDPNLFHTNRTKPSKPIVLLTARLLWDKGIGEFVEAARLLRQRNINARFVIVGGQDPGNRASIDQETLSSWHQEGAVELWGFSEDIPNILAQSSIMCLPSYREGLPKSLIEAMAAKLPCVTTDVPGCREAVRHNDNGLLVPPKNIAALAKAIETLLLNHELSHKMGLRGYERLVTEFSSEIVIKDTICLYKELLEL
ncbi:glycosyltransferase family 4 protein [Chromobacterium subtsugae]|uniref:Glycosyltransferase family 4 protein n=2 Tax=Pseudomonadota TaxID=1224 RepID=A0ABS7FFX9_9NEIS|nr:MULTISPECIES: glycosyltransferase family 4 protein [Chromobacterium]KUM03984.1 glycosyl transferase family 1 [Chromobacterium subtsugae]KZE86444.1 glycosyl transferase family 1 [Chromobacterium sp. F49]MBW7567711.1 glycosyltransferase family 4 protein [Chromobacterium subtsugae]MBW8288937.1 glycosyltransferase family 4 protein [Chromobacterium subtsugae]OBU85683.1 glycosyl transferase family 1 [Chromobacterium subtsugae]